MARAAEKQFWGCPELVEGLLPFMDTLSVRRLVQVSNILALPYRLLLAGGGTMAGSSQD